jgi:hypothetical protein
MHTFCKGCIHKNWTGTEAENEKGTGGSIKCDAVGCHHTSDCHPNELVVNRQALFVSSTGGGSKPQTQPKCNSHILLARSIGPNNYQRWTLPSS